MKAKEYYAKYHDRLIDTKTRTSATAALLKDLDAECETTIKSRRITTFDARESVKKELNTKFNAINALFEQKDGITVFVKDAYLNLRVAQAPKQYYREPFWTQRRAMLGIATVSRRVAPSPAF